MSRVEELMGSNPAPTVDDITEAFWQACSGGQRRVVENLLSKGVDINGVPGYTDQMPLDSAGSLDTRRNTLVAWLKSKGAKSSKQS
jgi:ankyrin repeat protein